VVADFIGGAAERLVLRAAEGNEVVLVEGQGSLVHPGYSGVTLGLLHGSMPDAMVLCHQQSRRCPYNRYNVYHWMTLPTVQEMIRINEAAIAPLRSDSKVIGICLNTWDLSDEEARAAVERTQQETGLPTTDPVRFDPAPVVEAILAGAERKRSGQAVESGVS
ncbi:MAG TPA: NAD-dependent epimerase/dehydratase family protein, partial [Longimicrobiaceae bacterium]|nr:NAD-dependent epimerase/dehydratase family protein [Longimicrobiaceae bacterium]